MLTITITCCACLPHPQCLEFNVTFLFYSFDLMNDDTRLIRCALVPLLEIRDFMEGPFIPLTDQYSS